MAALALERQMESERLAGKGATVICRKWAYCLATALASTAGGALGDNKESDRLGCCLTCAHEGCLHSHICMHPFSLCFGLCVFPTAAALLVKQQEQREWQLKVDSIDAGDLPRYVEVGCGERWKEEERTSGKEIKRGRPGRGLRGPVDI